MSVERSPIPRLVPDEAARVAALALVALMLLAVSWVAELSRRTARDLHPVTLHCPDGARRVDGRVLCGEGRGGRLSTSELLLVGTKIDINAATEADLELIPGIGPALAGRIVADRALRGPFTSVEALDRVPGIGSTLVGVIGDFARVRP